jgi:hypothetical protein
MADINAYALGLELQLQTAPAMDALNKFGAALKAIQKDMTGVAASFTPSASAAIQQETTMTEALRAAKASLSERMKRIQDAQQAAMFQGLSFAESVELQEKEIRKAGLAIKSAYEQLEKLSKLTRALTPDEKKLQEQLEKQLDAFEDIGKQLNKDKDTYKNQNTFMQTMATNILGTSQSMKSLLQTISMVPAEFGKAGIAMALFAKGLADIIEMQTDYAPSTMRALGSQEELIRMTNRLRATLGVSAKVGVETFKALADAGFTAEHSLSEVAETNIRFSKSTGVSQGTVAEYQRRLEFLTGSSYAAEKSLDAMSNMIVKTGMDAKKAGELLNVMAQSVDALALYYGTEQAKKYQKELVAIAGAEQKIAGRTTLSTAFTKVLADPRARLELRRMGIVLKDSASASQNYMKVLHGLTNTQTRYRGNTLALQSILRGTGMTEADINDAKAMLQIQKDRNLTDEQFIQGMVTGKGLVANSEDAWSDLTTQLGRASEAFMSIFSSLAEDLGPILKTIAHVLGKVAGGIANVIEEMMKFGPTRILLKGLGVALGVVFSIKAVMMIKSFGTAIMGVGKTLKALTGVASTAAKATEGASTALSGGPTAGAGIKTFMTNLAEGIKAFGDPKVLLGVLVLGVMAAVVGGTLIAVAVAIEKFNLSAADIGLAAGGLILASVAFYIMAAALAVLGPVAAYVAPLLFPLAIAFLAIGAAVTLAGLGIKLAAEGLVELFKVVIDGGLQFVGSIWALSFAFPLLAISIAALGASLVLAAPAILFGFGALLVAAGMAAIANPILADTGEAMMKIATAASLVRGGTGAGLLSLAKGITAFMGALMGIAAIGAAGQIASFFGVVKSPIAQAQQIAKAITTIMEPASRLSHAVGKLASVGDFMGPLLDSVLSHEEDIKRTLKILNETAEQLEKIDKVIGEGKLGIPLTIAATPAAPVKTPITEDTARKASDERQQAEMLRGNREIRNTLMKIENGVNDDVIMLALAAFLKEWLPKIAKKDGQAGLASTFSQWGGS